MRRISVLAMLVVGTACASNRAAFRPTDHVTQSGPGGRSAASYELRTSQQAPSHLRVNVWSRGAYVADGRTLARVALEVRNTGDEPVMLDTGALRLDAYRNSGAQLPPARLVRTSQPGASLWVPPDETGTIQLVYAIPAAVRPDDIGSMRLRWAVEREDGQRYVQFTDFRRVRETYATTGFVYYDPIWGYYDPFWYGPPYAYHLHHRVPVGRTVIRDRGTVHTVQRER